MKHIILGGGQLIPQTTSGLTPQDMAKYGSEIWEIIGDARKGDMPEIEEISEVPEIPDYALPDGAAKKKKGKKGKKSGKKKGGKKGKKSGKKKKKKKWHIDVLPELFQYIIKWKPCVYNTGMTVLHEGIYYITASYLFFLHVHYIADSFMKLKTVYF